MELSLIETDGCERQIEAFALTAKARALREHADELDREVQRILRPREEGYKRGKEIANAAMRDLETWREAGRPD